MPGIRSSSKTEYTGGNILKETIEFGTVQNIEGAAIAIERTPDFFQAAQQLSEFVHGLALDQHTNDQLVAMMVDQVQQAEKGAFAHGFRMGMEFERHERNSGVLPLPKSKLPIS